MKIIFPLFIIFIIKTILSSTKMEHYKTLSLTSSSPIYAGSKSLSTSDYYANYPSNFLTFSSHKIKSNPFPSYSSFTKTCYTSTNIVSATISNFEIFNKDNFENIISSTLYSDSNTLSIPILSCGGNIFILVEIISDQAKILLFNSRDGTNIKNSTEITVLNNIIDCAITKTSNFIICFYYLTDNKASYYIFNSDLTLNYTSSAYNCSYNENNCRDSIEPDISKTYHGIKLSAYNGDNVLFSGMKDKYLYVVIIQCASSTVYSGTYLYLNKISTLSYDGNYASVFECNVENDITYWDTTMLSDNIIAGICNTRDNVFIYSEILIVDNEMSFYTYNNYQRRNIDISSYLPTGSIFINLIIVSNGVSGVFFNYESKACFSLVHNPVCNDFEVESTIYVNTEIDFLNNTNFGINQYSYDVVYVVIKIPNDENNIFFTTTSTNTDLSTTTTTDYESNTHKPSYLIWKYNSIKSGTYIFDFSVSSSASDSEYMFCKLTIKVNPSLNHCISSEIISKNEQCIQCEDHYFINSENKCDECDYSCLKCYDEANKCLINSTCTLYDSINVCCVDDTYYPTYFTSDDITEFCFTENEGIENGYYFDNNLFKKCDVACSRCNGPENSNCLDGDTSYNNDYGIYCSDNYYPYKIINDDDSIQYICYTEEEGINNNSLYLNGNIFFKCDSACLNCNGETNSNCLQDTENCAYDNINNQFNSYNICCNTNYYPFKNADETYTCYTEEEVEMDNKRYYLTSENIFLQCDISCKYCNGILNSNCLQDSTKCLSNIYNICCNTNYYPFKNPDNTYACYQLTDDTVITNRYYLTSDNIFLQCDIACLNCNGDTNSNCLQDTENCAYDSTNNKFNSYNICCNTDYYPFKNEDNTYTCYQLTEDTVITNRYFLSTGNILKQCDSACLYCNGLSNTNCLQDPIKCPSSTFNDYFLCCNTGYYAYKSSSNSYICYSPSEAKSNHLYLSNNMYFSCHSSCIYCTGPDNTDCTIDSLCTSNPQNLCCNTNSFPLIEETTKKCLTESEGTLEGYYLDSTTKTFLKCSSECKTCLSFNKCLSCDNIYYIKVDGEYKCLPSNIIQEGYYIDNNLYKKCYNTCKTCSKGGRNNINNCNECIYGNLIKTSDSTSNCCTEDKQLWYLSGSNFFCISSCPEIRPIFVEKTNQCVENCLSNDCIFCNDNNYNVYLYNSKCYTSCPDGYEPNEKNICLINEHNVCDYEYYISPYTIKQLTNLVDFIAQNYSDFYIGKTNQVTLIKGEKDNYLTTIYESLDCIKALKNQTIINMTECINKVFSKMSIPNNTKVITLKTDYTEKKGSSPILAYSFYFLNGSKIDISLCQKENITIKVQLTTQNSGNFTLAQNLQSKYNINIYDINDPFFTDFCMPFTSEDGKDVSLKDRIKNYYQNYSICESGCTYKGINMNGNVAEADCECETKTNFILDNLNNSVTGEFAEILANANFNLFACYKNVFNSKKWSINLGGWVIVFFAFVQIVFLIMYCNNGFKSIFVELEENSKRIIRRESMFKSSPPKKKSNLKSNLKSIPNEITIKKIKYSNIKKTDNNKNKNIIKKEIDLSNDLYSNDENDKEENNKSNNKKKENKNISFEQFDSPIQLKKEKKVNIHEKNLSSIIDSSSTLRSPSINLSNESLSNEVIIYEYVTPNDLLQKDFSEDELNEMVVEDARKYDKRTFCYFYFSKLKEKQDIINIFCKQKNLESFQMRVIVFFYGMSLYFFINALLYIESYISTEIHSKGKSFSFMAIIENEIQRCLFSQIVSFFVDLFERCLDNSTKRLDVLLRSEKKSDSYLRKSHMIIKQMKRLHMWFIIFNFFSMAIFWYFCCAFCDVKYNSRINWLEGSIITFSIVNCFPFFMCFISTCFRYIGLKFNYLGIFYRIGQWID